VRGREPTRGHRTRVSVHAKRETTHPSLSLAHHASAAHLLERRDVGERQAESGAGFTSAKTSRQCGSDLLQFCYGAEQMHRQTLGLNETILGKDHPSTLASMNNLGSVPRDQGKCEQAEEMHRQGLRLRETVLGKEHADPLMSVSNLAGVLEDQGRYEQAEQMHRQALGVRETALAKSIYPH
jgi:hypothetical protein